VAHRIKLEVWADVLFPWCWVVKRRLAAALDACSGRERFEVEWRSFEILPNISRVPDETIVEMMVHLDAADGNAALERFGEIRAQVLAELGLELNLEEARPVNSFDAHRLVHLAATQDAEDALLELLFRAYLTDNRNIANRAVLRELAAEAGLEAASVEALLTGPTHSDDVRADERRAAELEIAGVPTIVLDGRDKAAGPSTTGELAELLEGALGAARRP